MSHVGAVAVIIDCVLLLTLGAALYTDLTRGKVYDWLTLPAIGFGLLVNFFAGDIGTAQGNGLAGFLGDQFVASLAGLALALGVFGLAYLLHMLGGGDVKLLAAVGALMGLDFFLKAAILTACVGAVAGVGVLIWRGRLVEGLKSSLLALVAPRRFNRRRQSAPPGAAEMITIPYTIAIVIGTLAAWLLSPAGAGFVS